MQLVPEIVKQAERVFLFQRTANYSVPAHNAPLDPAYETRIKTDYANFRARNSLQINAFGSNLPRSSVPARDMTPQERQAAFDDRWRVGGLFFLGATGDLLR